MCTCTCAFLIVSSICNILTYLPHSHTSEKCKNIQTFLHILQTHTHTQAIGEVHSIFPVSWSEQLALCRGSVAGTYRCTQPHSHTLTLTYLNRAHQDQRLLLDPVKTAVIQEEISEDEIETCVAVSFSISRFYRLHTHHRQLLNCSAHTTTCTFTHSLASPQQ